MTEVGTIFSVTRHYALTPSQSLEETKKCFEFTLCYVLPFLS
jgi:hypothetical protein